MRRGRQRRLGQQLPRTQGVQSPNRKKMNPPTTGVSLAASSSPQGLQIRAHPGQHVDFSLRRPRAEKTVGYPDLWRTEARANKWTWFSPVSLWRLVTQQRWQIRLPFSTLRSYQLYQWRTSWRCLSPRSQTLGQWESIQIQLPISGLSLACVTLWESTVNPASRVPALDPCSEQWSLGGIFITFHLMTKFPVRPATRFSWCWATSPAQASIGCISLRLSFTLYDGLTKESCEKISGNLNALPGLNFPNSAAGKIEAVIAKSYAKVQREGRGLGIRCGWTGSLPSILSPLVPAAPFYIFLGLISLIQKRVVETFTSQSCK